MKHPQLFWCNCPRVVPGHQCSVNSPRDPNVQLYRGVSLQFGGGLSMALCTCLLSLMRPGRSTKGLAWHWRRCQSCMCARLCPILCNPADGSPPGSSALVGGFFTTEPQKHLEDQKTSNSTTWGQHTPDQWKFYFTLRICWAWRGCQPLGPRAFQAFRSIWRIHKQWGSAMRPFRKMLKLYIFINCSVFLMSTLIFFILIFLQNIV